MDNQNKACRGVDGFLWGRTENERGLIGDRDSYSRAAVHQAWHYTNGNLKKWKGDEKGAESEFRRVEYHRQKKQKGLSPLRK